MIQIKTFFARDNPTLTAEQASFWLTQQDGKIGVQSIMTDITGRMDANLVITIIYTTHDGERLLDGVSNASPEGS